MIVNLKENRRERHVRNETVSAWSRGKAFQLTWKIWRRIITGDFHTDWSNQVYYVPKLQARRSLRLLQLRQDCITGSLGRAWQVGKYRRHDIDDHPIIYSIRAFRPQLRPAVSAIQSSAGQHPHRHGHANAFSPSSLTLVNPTHRANRPSIKFKIPGGGSDILNCAVVDPAGRSLFSISSTSKSTSFVSCKNNVKFATVEWDRSSPLIVFPTRQRKVKCREWLPRARPETEYIPILVSAYFDSDRARVSSRVFTLGDSDSQFTWMNQSTSGYLIPANRHGLTVARWYVKSHSDELRLEIFQEALVESGLFEAIVLSLVLLRSGRSFRDIQGEISMDNGIIYPGHWP
ncbi:hypothetical protein BC827DRAFT_1385897 [Russula dissimulans]|nr:hypothetical protein BC827DRAFT_1385897 [Russula dissimulans]